MDRYELPSVLQGKCTQEDYAHWLYAQAAAHLKGDAKEGDALAALAIYEAVIHDAVCENGHVDAYTGRPLRWELIQACDDDESKQGKREYKDLFADLPTVNREDEELGKPRFKICSWRTSDCKNDLTVGELLRFCHEFIEYQVSI